MAASEAGRRSLSRPPAVARVLTEITAWERRHDMFEPGDRVLVAVSGGPDSVCLLHALVRLRRLLRIRPACFHFDHGLRPDSGRDAEYVARQARVLGVRFVLMRARGRPGKGESVEAWARTERYAALFSSLDALGGGTAAVGHTSDDQAETVLMALLRGAGLERVAGMRPVTRPVVRPLLSTTRRETAAFCRALHLRPRHDPMNEDPRFMRAALRHEVLPFLETTLGRNPRPAIVGTAERLRLDADLLDRLAGQAVGVALAWEGDDLLVDTWAVSSLDPALRGRVLHRAMLEAGLVHPEADHVDSLAALLAARPGRRVALPGPLIGRREKGYVRLSRPSPGAGD